jgi:hypothetical protein
MAAVCFLSILLLPTHAHSQSNTATLSGQVVDPQGLPLSAVREFQVLHSGVDRSIGDTGGLRLTSVASRLRWYVGI